MSIIAAAAGPQYPSVASTATIKLATTETGGRISVIQHDLELGAGPPPHTHTHEEVILALVGTYDVLLGDEWQQARAGDLIHVPAGVVHTTKCTSADGGRQLSFYAPGGGEGFFREAGALPAGDIQALVALAARYDTHVVQSA